MRDMETVAAEGLLLSGTPFTDAELERVFSKNLKIFDSFFKKTFGEDASIEKQNIPKQLFKYLVSTYETENSEIKFKSVFHYFCNSCGKRLDLIYKCFIFMFEMIGFDSSCHFTLNKISKYKVQNPSLKKSVEILSELIAILKDHAGISSYKYCDRSFSDFIIEISRSLMHLTKSPDENCYKLLIDIMAINPLIIETIVEDVLPYIMLCDNRLSLNYDLLMITIIGTYAKLHRVQSLVSKMITSLKAALNKEGTVETQYNFVGVIDMDKRNFEYGCDIFTERMVTYFSQCITNLASWQIINLFKTLTFHLKLAVNELNDMDQGLYKLVYIELLSTLMCSLLSTVRIAEHTVPQNVVEKFLKEMEELKEILANFGKALLKMEHNCVLMKSFLHISYAWGEVYMMLAYYSEGNIECKGIYDSNTSACNITYLHPYLSVREWCLISERITNFGEKACKLIMQKLFCQKLRAMWIFEDVVKEELKTPVAKELSSYLNESWKLVITDKFIVNNLIGHFNTHDVVHLAEYWLKDAVQDIRWNILYRSYLLENQRIRNGVIYVIFSLMTQLMKQKRKLDENYIWKPMNSIIFSSISSEHFISEDEQLSGVLDQAKSIFHDEIGKETDINCNISVNTTALLEYLNILEKTPLIFCSEMVQTLIAYYILSLHKDSHQLKEFSLKEKFEKLLIGILQQNKIDVTEAFLPAILIPYVAKYFKNVDTFFIVYLENLIKSEKQILEFEGGVQFLSDNVRKPEYLPICVHLLNAISKWKKHKQTLVMKSKIEEYHTLIQKKLLKMILRRNVESCLIEPYAILLKMGLSRPEDDALAKLKSLSDSYLEHVISNSENCRGAALLYTTILRHKSDLNLSDSICLRVWNTVNIDNLSFHMLEEYSPLVQLIFEHVPNEEFQEMTKKLLEVTRGTVETKNMAKLSVFVKVWSAILSSNFNPAKLKIWQEMLEGFMLDIFTILDDLKSNAYILQDVVTFVNCIVQTVHLPLTPSMCDVLLMFPAALLLNKSGDFTRCYALSMSVLTSLLKYHKVVIMDRLPSFLQGYKMLLGGLCKHGNSDLNLTLDEIHSISDCAHSLEKLTNSIVACKKDMARISCFLIADILSEFEEVTLYPGVKKHVDNCIYSLISLCDQHAVSYLMRTLSIASTEMFKIMYEHYKKYYKFTGRV